MSRTENVSWSGDLARTPFFAVLRRIQRDRLTGRLRVAREQEDRLLFFEAGELRAARSSMEEHRLGASLVGWGYITAADLADALQTQRSHGRRLDQILVESGVISRNTLDAESERLMEHIVSSTLSWPSGAFAFETNDGGEHEDIAFTLSVTKVIIEGIRRIPESQEFLGPLGDLAQVGVAIPDALKDLGSVALPADAALLLSCVDGRTSAQDLLKLVPGSRRAAAKLLYMLVYCGFMELRAPAAEPAVAADAPSKVEEPVSQHRDLVQRTYRRIDWLSHYDLLGLSLDASPEQVEEAYARLGRLFDPALQRRPDLADCRRELTVLAQRLRAAYEVLSSPLCREAYDEEIQRAQSLLPDGQSAKIEESDASAAKTDTVRRWTASKNYKKALELVGKKDFYPAIEMLEEAVRFAPDNARYRLLLGQTKMRNPWWIEQGLAELEEAARIEPRSAKVQSALAEGYLQCGAPEKALASARSALNVAASDQKESYRNLEKRAEDAVTLENSGRHTVKDRLLGIA